MARTKAKGEMVQIIPGRLAAYIAAAKTLADLDRLANVINAANIARGERQDALNAINKASRTPRFASQPVAWTYINRVALADKIAAAKSLTDLDAISEWLIINSPGVSNRAKAREYAEAQILVDAAERAPRFRRAREDRAREKVATIIGASKLVN